MTDRRSIFQVKMNERRAGGVKTQCVFESGHYIMPRAGPWIELSGSGVSFIYVAAALIGSHSEPADSDPGPPTLRLFSREVGRQPADEFADILSLDEDVSRPDDLSHETFAP